MSDQAEELAQIEADPSVEDATADAPRHEIAVSDRFEIFPDKSLTPLDVPGASAFVAEDTKNPKRALFARITDRGLFPRGDAVLRIRAMRGVSLMAPVHFGQVRWPGESGARMVTVFDLPPQGPIMASLGDRIEPMSAEEISQGVLLPVMRVLQQFHQRGLTHRAIRPDNIFPPSGDSKTALLGECVSTPVGWGLPASFEPIPLMMCDRDARGKAWIEDDLYALGATILILSLGHDPTQGMDDEDLLAAKMEAGSYAALLQGERAPPGLREPLRGLLVDDVRERWDFEDIERWSSGTLRRSTQLVQDYKSDRSFSFAGADYQSCRPLAHAFGKNWEQAADAIKSSAFDSWLKRGIGEPALSDAVDEVVAVAQQGKGAAQETMMISRVCMLLDRNGPLRFKQSSVMPDGIGTALARGMVEPDDEKIRVARRMHQIRSARGMVRSAARGRAGRRRHRGAHLRPSGQDAAPEGAGIRR